MWIVPVLIFLSPFQSVLTGKIIDPSGAPIPQALIVLRNLERNARYQESSGDDGGYLFNTLRPGQYSATIEASGFKTLLREGITLTTGETIRVDFELSIGSIQDSVTITSDAPLLRTESADLGQVIENHKIVELPLNGRSFISLTALAPGVALPPGSSFPRINGGRPRTNEYLFDGVTVLQPEPGQVTFMPIIDAIQEFKIETNSPPAEFGRFNGGVINLTTKSGTNHFHGSIFEFLRNESLNARNLFAPATSSNSKKPLFRRNQFGFVLGGPVVRDKSFFFADYQGTRQLIGRVRTSTVPTLLQRQGIFTEPISGIVPTVLDPATTHTEAGTITRNPFPSHTIPRERMDPAATSLLERYPLPTSPGTANNYRRIGNERTNQDQWDARLDQRVGASDTFFARYSSAQDASDPVTPLPDGSGDIASGVIGNTSTVGQSLAASYLHVFDSRRTNEIRVGYSRRNVDRTSITLPGSPSDVLGIPGIPNNGAFSSALPTFVIDGYQQLGSPANTYSKLRTDVTHIADTFSLQDGSHFIKAGGELRLERLDILQPPSPVGMFRFSASETGLPNLPGSGQSLASFLLGQVDHFSIDLQPGTIRPRAMIQEYFIQDDWKASQRLTVNAGVRYTLNFPSTETENQGAVFDLTTQALHYLGRDGFPRSSRMLHKLNFGPRLGVAYRLTNKTVVRSGYGLIWIEQAGVTTPFTNPQFPFIQTVTQRTLDNVTPAFVLSSGPSVSTVPLTPEAGLGQGVFTVDRNLGSGYVQQWNLSFQHEITPNTLVEAAYTGSKITHVGIPDTNINQLTTDQLKLGSQLLERVPNPFYGTIPSSSSLGGLTITRAQLLKPFPEYTTVSFFRNNVGNTVYHSFQAKLENRFSHGISLLASYTRSKLIDEASSVFNAAILTGPVADFPVADSLNRKLERDVSSGDIPNAFVVNATYELPARGDVFGGWQLSGILKLQSGLPLALTQLTNFNAFAGFGTQRPDRIRNPNLPKEQRTTSRYFDTEALVAAPQFSLGNSSRNPVRGPGLRNLDLALIKRTALREKCVIEFRAEAFNVTNTPVLGSPNTVLGSPGFGSITTAGDPRILQLALKLHF